MSEDDNTDLPYNITMDGLWEDIDKDNLDILILQELSEPYIDEMTPLWNRIYTVVVSRILSKDNAVQEASKRWLDQHLDPMVTKRVRTESKQNSGC